jgi:hypothetical protein
VLGRYIISDKPMSEEEWTRERATQCFSRPVVRKPLCHSGFCQLTTGSAKLQLTRGANEADIVLARVHASARRGVGAAPGGRRRTSELTAAARHSTRCRSREVVP